MCKFQGAYAVDFVALQLILDWGRQGAFEKISPLVKPEVNKVGIALIAHKKAVNVINCLYVKD